MISGDGGQSEENSSLVSSLVRVTRENVKMSLSPSGQCLAGMHCATHFTESEHSRDTLDSRE